MRAYGETKKKLDAAEEMLGKVNENPSVPPVALAAAYAQLAAAHALLELAFEIDRLAVEVKRNTHLRG